MPVMVAEAFVFGLLTVLSCGTWPVGILIQQEYRKVKAQKLAKAQAEANERAKALAEAESKAQAEADRREQERVHAEQVVAANAYLSDWLSAPTTTDEDKVLWETKLRGIFHGTSKAFQNIMWWLQASVSKDQKSFIAQIWSRDRTTYTTIQRYAVSKIQYAPFQGYGKKHFVALHDCDVAEACGCEVEDLESLLARIPSGFWYQSPFVRLQFILDNRKFFSDLIDFSQKLEELRQLRIEDEERRHPLAFTWFRD